MWNAAFWKAAAERVVRAVIVVLAGLFAVAGEFPSWEDTWQACLAAAIASLALSFGGNALGGEEHPGPSLVGTEVTSPPAVTPVVPNEQGAGEGRFILLVAGAVLLALLLFFVVFPALAHDDDHDGKHGNDWERAPHSSIAKPHGNDWEKTEAWG